MSLAKVLVAIVIVGIVGGCTPAQKSALAPGKTRLTVDFQQNQSLRYRFLSSRDITVDWGQMQGRDAGKTKIDKSLESLELVVSYTPVEVDPYGLSTIKAACESAKVARTGQSPRQMSRPDAAQSFAGKSWTFTVGPTGKMEDRSQLYDCIRQAGQQAFRTDKSQGLVKEPDMIYDFIATQWFLWDSISSVTKPVAGVGVGDEWRSRLFVPASMILFAARDVNYRLEEIRQGEQGRIAVIGGSYTLLYPSPSDWPVPYTELFQMSGTFGFLRGYKVFDLQGQGQELFNIDAGRTEKYTQKYPMHVQASLPMGLGLNPQITIDQTLTMELITAEKKD
ncbi:MAG: hypothetical protein MUO27_08030 [Sedimentisphaerales bacterium]|nr:hypothetical protein [Sedimentisphaerales bacterium]